MDYYRAFPFYMGYQGYGQWPSQPGFVPEDRIMEDLEYLRQMYPTYAKKYQIVVSNIVDKMDYDGSFIYDQYPDRVTLQRMVDSVMAVIKANEEKENPGNGMDSGMRDEWQQREAPQNAVPRSVMPRNAMMQNGWEQNEAIQNEKMQNTRSQNEWQQNEALRSVVPQNTMPQDGWGPNGAQPNVVPQNAPPQGGGMPLPENGGMMQDSGEAQAGIRMTEYVLTENAPWSEKEPWIRELVTVLVFYEILLRRRRKNKYWGGFNI